MPTLQVEIDGETHEVDSSAVQLPDEYDLVSPDNASSKGYFTQAQFNEKIKSRLSTRDKVVKDELQDDEEFIQEAASRKWGISFDEEGQPKGLKPEVDVDEVRKKAVENVKKDYESKVDDISSKASTYKDRLIEQSILSATKGDWKDQFTKSQDDGRVKPIVVNQFRDMWDIDEQGNVALQDSDGEGFAVGPKGQHITPDEYLTNRDKFGDYMQDNRQKGSDFQGGGSPNGKPIYTEQQIEQMSEAEFEKQEDQIMQAMAEGRVQK